MSKITAIINGNIVLEDGIIFDGTLVYSDGLITAFGNAEECEIPEGAEIIDAAGAYVGPGFVDIHVHGGGGYQMYSEPREAAAYFLSHGETTVCATPSRMASREAAESAEYIKGIREVIAAGDTNLRGIYLEGPYFNGNYGANKKLNTWGTRPIVPEDYKPLVDAGGTDIKVWMVAPEREGLLPFLKYAREVNPDVVFAVGHSEALPSEIRSMTNKYRPTLQTHSMNATGRKKYYGGGIRDFGPDEYFFKEPDTYCELICDSMGIHVHKEMQQLLIHNKGIDKVVLITDSTYYNNPNPERYAKATDLNFDDFGGLAGSKLTMDKACRNIMTHTNCGIAQAFLMAATNPAKAVGFYDELGSIDIGKRADLVFVDDRFNVKKVILGGRVC